MKNRVSKPCPTCRLIRTFLLIAIPFLFLMWFRPDLPLLSDFDLTGLAANGIALGCFAVICTKAYREFWLPYRAKRMATHETSSNDLKETINVQRNPVQKQAPTQAEEPPE